MCQRRQDTPHVAGPEARLALPTCDKSIDGHAVVDHERAPAGAEALQVDEVRQSGFEQVEAIDVSEIERKTVENGLEIKSREELVAGHDVDLGFFRNFFRDGGRIDAETPGRRKRLSHGIAACDPDFKIGPRLQVSMHARENLEVVFAGKSQAR